MPKKPLKSRTGAVPSRHSRGLAAPWIALLAVILVAAAILLLLPREVTPAQVDVVQAKAMYDRGALFLDVRTAEEWDQGHIANSVLIPLDELPDRLEELPRDMDIVVVCRSGNRSKEGTSILREAGFTHVTCMDGGLQAWVAAGYPVEQ